MRSTQVHDRNRPAEVQVVVGSVYERRCRWCRKTIKLATVGSRDRLAAHTVAFNVDAAAIERKVNEDTGVAFDIFLSTDRHRCPAKPKTNPTPKRLRQAAEVGQGRIW